MRFLSLFSKASIPDSVATDLAFFSARFSLIDFPCFLDIVLRGDLSDNWASFVCQTSTVSFPRQYASGKIPAQGRARRAGTRAFPRRARIDCPTTHPPSAERRTQPTSASLVGYVVRPARIAVRVTPPSRSSRPVPRLSSNSTPGGSPSQLSPTRRSSPGTTSWSRHTPAE